MNLSSFLQQRSIIEISGADRKSFLQGLITNNINKATKNSLIYAAMLNAKGQFLYDLFIFEKDEKLLLDCANSRCDEIAKKLNFYKLRADVTIKKNDEILIAQNLNSLGLTDPRNKNLGHRIYATKAELEKNSDKLLSNQDYQYLRIENKIAESELDLTNQKSFILEFGFNQLNAVDYEKGCYVGQELTARTHHLGEIRKKLFHIKIDGKLPSEFHKIDSLKNNKISCEGKKLGVILSSSFYKDELHALALLRIADYESKNSDFLKSESQDSTESENLKISVIN